MKAICRLIYFQEFHILKVRYHTTRSPSSMNKSANKPLPLFQLRVSIFNFKQFKVKLTQGILGRMEFKFIKRKEPRVFRTEDNSENTNLKDLLGIYKDTYNTSYQNEPFSKGNANVYK